MNSYRCTKCDRFGYAGIPCVKCGGITAPTLPALPDPIVTHAPIFVSKQQILDWRKEWMSDHPCEDGHDHVTPFDHVLYQALPYDRHTQRLRSACSNIKWSEVPLAKLEAIAAVLCTYDCVCPSGDGSLRWPCPAHPPQQATP